MNRPEGITPADKPRNAWERVVTLTPVAMTLVATVLAGLSTSEMTRAQFYRSTAAQFQSKAGDHWAFFQAKKIRGAELELTVDRLPVAVRPGGIGADMIGRDAARLTAALEDASKKAAVLLEAAGKQDDPNVRRALEAFQERLQAKNGTLSECRKRLEDDLRKEQIFAYVGAGALPAAKDPVEIATGAKEAAGNPQLLQATKAIVDHRPEHEIALLVKPIKAATIFAAIEAAEAHVLAVERATAPIDEEIKKLTSSINDLLSQAALCHRAALEVELNKPPAEVDPAREFLQSDRRVNAAAEELNNLWLSARHDFTARCYKREADENMKTAILLEVQVRHASAISESHRERSQYFFIGLLIAQAGVFISSLALAARQRSLLWSLAAGAGLAAAAFSGWVYLSM